MREWWRYHIEEPLDRMFVNWDMSFLYYSTMTAVLTVLSGGQV